MQIYASITGSVLESSEQLGSTNNLKVFRWTHIHFPGRGSLTNISLAIQRNGICRIKYDINRYGNLRVRHDMYLFDKINQPIFGVISFPYIDHAGSGVSIENITDLTLDYIPDAYDGIFGVKLDVYYESFSL